jgi:hypothetical protein
MEVALSQVLLHLLWSSKFHCRVHESSIAPCLTYINPHHKITPHFLDTSFNITVLSTTTSTMLPLSSRFSDARCVSLLRPCVCPYHPPRLVRINVCPTNYEVSHYTNFCVLLLLPAMELRRDPYRRHVPEEGNRLFFLSLMGWGSVHLVLRPLFGLLY